MIFYPKSFRIQRIIPLLLLMLVFTSGCKTSRRTSTSRSTSDKISVVFDANESTTSSSSVKKSSESVKPIESARYPAAEYYGDSWNNEHVRYSSGKPAGTVDLTMIPSGTGDFVMPVCGKILSEFGPRNGRMHTGIDIKLEINDPVYCAFDGTVRMAKEYGGYGKMVVVRHENGLETLYSHLNSIAVKVNRKLKAGDIVGGGGRTGQATGVHLHFETRFQNEPFNPRLAVNFEKCALQSNTLTLNEKSYLLYGKQMQPAETKIAQKSEPKKQPTISKTAEPDGTQIIEHIVEKGDTLYNISRRYGMTVDSLRKLNQLSESTVLQVGQKLVVESSR